MLLLLRHPPSRPSVTTTGCAEKHAVAGLAAERRHFSRKVGCAGAVLASLFVCHVPDTLLRLSKLCRRCSFPKIELDHELFLNDNRNKQVLAAGHGYRGICMMRFGMPPAVLFFA
jgi:hypothetical protein